MMPPPNNELTASVCCMVGLPGSGKSTVARRIVELHEQERYNRVNSGHNHTSNDTPLVTQFDNILIIDYDSIAQQELVSCDGKKDVGSKDANFYPQNTSFDSNDLEAWRNSRIRALDTLKDALAAHFSSNESKSSLLVLMDDNFHLRSMRRDVYRTCQDVLAMELVQPTNEHAQPIIAFSTMYFSTPVEVCLQRNNSRVGKERIPPDVVSRMASNIEPPDETKPYASFECFHVSFDNSDADMITTDSKILHDIDQCLQKALQSPILPKNETSPEEIAQMEQQRMRQREETLKCQVQRIDQLLRKLVGAVGRVEKKRSREANDTRKCIMEKIRSGHESMVDNMSDETIVGLFVCSILGIETNSGWHELDDPLAQSVKDALQQFQQDRGKYDKNYT